MTRYTDNDASCLLMQIAKSQVRVEQDVHNVRAAELAIHRGRATQHAKAVDLALAQLDGRAHDAVAAMAQHLASFQVFF